MYCISYMYCISICIISSRCIVSPICIVSLFVLYPLDVLLPLYMLDQYNYYRNLPSWTTTGLVLCTFRQCPMLCMFMTLPMWSWTIYSLWWEWAAATVSPPTATWDRTRSSATSESLQHTWTVMWLWSYTPERSVDHKSKGNYHVTGHIEQIGQLMIIEARVIITWLVIYNRKVSRS